MRTKWICFNATEKVALRGAFVVSLTVSRSNHGHQSNSRYWRQSDQTNRKTRTTNWRYCRQDFPLVCAAADHRRMGGSCDYLRHVGGWQRTYQQHEAQEVTV